MGNEGAAPEASCPTVPSSVVMGENKKPETSQWEVLLMTGYM